LTTVDRVPERSEIAKKSQGHYEARVLAAYSNGGDTQSRNLYKKLVQVDLYKKLDRLTWFLV